MAIEFDVDRHLSAMERQVSFLDRAGKGASVVTLSRTYSVSVEDLWDAITNADRIPLWFAPVSGNFELGGRYAIEGNASGTITDCKRLSSFALTWEFAGDVSWVEANLSKVGDDEVRVTLSHTAHLSPHWDTYGPGAVGVGWEMGFLGLAMQIARPSDPRPDDMEFATSRDGKAFITGSSEAWGEAAIAAGTNAEIAQESAGRTTAFYTGESV